MDYSMNTIEKSTAYVAKIRSGIDSCQNVYQLNCLKTFIVRYWDNMKFVGLQGFVALELKDQYNAKLETLKFEEDEKNKSLG